MLALRIRVILTIGLVVALWIVIRAVIKKKLDVKYSLPWFFMLVSLAIFDAFPGLLDILTRMVGISSPSNMLFFFGFCFSLIIIFYLTSTIFSLSNRLRKVAQELALLRKEMEERLNDDKEISDEKSND